MFSNNNMSCRIPLCQRQTNIYIYISIYIYIYIYTVHILRSKACRKAEFVYSKGSFNKPDRGKQSYGCGNNHAI
jgi:hypothetical protein